MPNAFRGVAVVLHAVGAAVNSQVAARNSNIGQRTPHVPRRGRAGIPGVAGRLGVPGKPFFGEEGSFFLARKRGNGGGHHQNYR